MLQRKQKPFPTGIGCHILCTRKKINRASAQPAQGPSLKPRSPGKAASLCFPVCGQLAGQGARGERPRWKKIPRCAKLCGLQAPEGGLWLRPQTHRARRNELATDSVPSPAFLICHRLGCWACFSLWGFQGITVLVTGLGAFLSRFWTLHGWQGHVSPCGHPSYQMGAPAYLRLCVTSAVQKGHSLPLALLAFVRGGPGTWQKSQ